MTTTQPSFITTGMLLERASDKARPYFLTMLEYETKCEYSKSFINNTGFATISAEDVELIALFIEDSKRDIQRAKGFHPRWFSPRYGAIKGTRRICISFAKSSLTTWIYAQRCAELKSDMRLV